MMDQIVENVIDKYYRRSQIGIGKYGTTLEDNNEDDFFKHLQEELMDASLYVEKLIVLNKDLIKLVKKHPNDAELGTLVRNLVRDNF
jgi:hypothetical protein